MSLRPKAGGRRRLQIEPQLTLGLGLSAEVPAAPVVRAYEPIVLAAEPVAREPVVYTVRQLIGEIRQQVEGAYAGSVTLEGEISNCRPASSGHVYFTLKDGDAQLPAVLFRARAQLLAFKPRDGMAVEVRGRISVYETRGAATADCGYHAAAGDGGAAAGV